MAMYFKRIFSAFLFCMSSVVLAQDDQKIELKNLAPPNSPAFVLMDVTPSNIIVPQNIQAFSLQTISAFTGDSNDGMSSNNYAFEFQPYWYVKRSDMNFFKYNNLTTDKAIPAGSKPAVDDYNGLEISNASMLSANFDVKSEVSYVSSSNPDRASSVPTWRASEGSVRARP